jgi:hypothetical protein
MSHFSSSVEKGWMLRVAVNHIQDEFSESNRTEKNKLSHVKVTYEGVCKSFRTGRLERELQMVQLSATRCSSIAILCIILVSLAAITLCVASQRVFIFVYFVIDSARKLLDTPSYCSSKRLCASICSFPMLLAISGRLVTSCRVHPLRITCVKAVVRLFVDLQFSFFFQEQKATVNCWRIW